MTLKDLKKLVNSIDAPDDTGVWFNVVNRVNGKMEYDNNLDYHSWEHDDGMGNDVNINFTEC